MIAANGFDGMDARDEAGHDLRWLVIGAQQIGRELRGKQRVAVGNRHHQRIAPGRLRDDAVTDLIGACEPQVVGVFQQPLDLLRQTYFGQTDFDVRLVLATSCQQSGES